MKTLDSGDISVSHYVNRKGVTKYDAKLGEHFVNALLVGNEQALDALIEALDRESRAAHSHTA